LLQEVEEDIVPISRASSQTTAVVGAGQSSAVAAEARRTGVARIGLLAGLVVFVTAVTGTRDFGELLWWTAVIASAISAISAVTAAATDATNAMAIVCSRRPHCMSGVVPGRMSTLVLGCGRTCRGFADLSLFREIFIHNSRMALIRDHSLSVRLKESKKIHARGYLSFAIDRGE
jgi:hypothetical protein